MKNPAESTGSQAIDRATKVLGLVAEAQGAGASLAQIVTQSGLNQATTRRLLVALIRAGLVEQEESSRRYFLGVSAYVFGVIAAERFGRYPMADAAVRRLAEGSEDTAFFSLRQGMNSICLRRVEGVHPFRSHVLNVGQQHPLGVAAHGIAILAALPPAETDAIIAGNLEIYRDHYPMLTEPLLRDLIAETRRRGWAINRGIFHSAAWAISVAVRGMQGEVLGALSIGAMENRLGEARQPQIVKLLQAEARKLEAAFATMGASAMRG
ncbi:IclR family transcriptional regulator [Pseudomonas sp. GX19020]|uniref:IclR family transcriptional regulator n=1 Tax=Pseudomonas sp. GX19020 TaxID=2942277 RepID=UPI00201892AF|nr:IclR family transcriptional regulator [Pseudomonas sp. GX19020]MCL4068103.1 IclR family transcriptional regulator [Pseudomonas sp. GX19020]